MDVEKYKKVGRFTLSSGLETTEYYDLKEAMGDPNNLEEMIVMIFNKIKQKPDLVVGLEFGGIPLAIGLSLKLHIPYAILRKERKGHGTKKRIEGFQQKGNALVVDDVSTTGKTLVDAVRFLRDNGYGIIQVETIVKREDMR